MPIYVVSHSTREIEARDTAFSRALDGAHTCPLMPSIWLVHVDQSVGELTKALLSHLRSDDRLFIIEFKPDLPWSATGLSNDAKAWIRARLPNVTSGTLHTPT